MRFTNTVKPSVYRFEVVLNRVVIRWFDLISVVELNNPSMLSSSQGLEPIFSTGEDFNMNHIVLLRFDFRVKVDSTVEHKISWFHFT